MASPQTTGLRAGYEAERGSVASIRRESDEPRGMAQPWEADSVSLLGVALCLAAGVSLALGAPLLVAAIMFPTGAACDFLDGRIARATQDRGSRLAGRFIDSMCDKVGEAALLLGLVLATNDRLAGQLMVAAFVCGSLASYTKAVAGEHRLGLDWPEAQLFGRAGRVTLLTLILWSAVVVGSQHHLAFVVGFSILLVFNLASFAWRLLRVAHNFR